jgi:YbbR domain-containing protein
MFQSIKDRIKKMQLRFFIIAVVLAYGLWFVGLNYTDPIITESFTLTLELRNENVLTEHRRVLMNDRDLEQINVTVHVTGLRSELQNLIRDESIVAFIDMRSSELIFMPNSGFNEHMPVRISVAFADGIPVDSLQITSIRPDIANVVIDRWDTRTFSTQILFNEEDLPDGYVTLTPEREPRSVVLTGPASVLSQINTRGVGVHVDVRGVRADVVGEREIIARNEFEHLVTGYSIDEPILRFRLPVVKLNTVNILLGETIGEPHADTAVVGMEWEPKTVELIGHVDEVEQIQSVVISSVDISGINETTTFTININDYLTRINYERGINVSLRNAAANIISVTCITEPIITQSFVIPIDEVHFSGEASRREIRNEYITVVLRGVSTVLNEIQAGDIICRVNAAALADMDDGEYTLDVDVTTPPGTELSGAPPSVVIVLSAPETVIENGTIN